jgi:hypothetical protein
MPANHDESGAQSRPPGCLLVVLRTRPLLLLTPECPDAVFWLEHKEFVRRSPGDWSGFYDWLRDAEGDLLGVRQWPFDDTAPWRDLLARLPASPYLVAQPDLSSLTIYFGDDRTVARQWSDDQDFGQNALFASTDGEWAISFGTAALSPPALQRLSSALVGSAAVRVGPRG